MGDVLKIAQNSKCVCLNEIISLIIMKMKNDHLDKT